MSWNFAFSFDIGTFFISFSFMIRPLSSLLYGLTALGIIEASVFIPLGATEDKLFSMSVLCLYSGLAKITLNRARSSDETF